MTSKIKPPGGKRYNGKGLRLAGQPASLDTGARRDEMEDIMTTPGDIADLETQRKAYAIYYAGGLRDRLLAEDPANHGRFLVLDVASGDYEIDDRLMEATLRLHQGHTAPESSFAFRIGYTASGKLGGRLQLEVEP